jgi:DnaJ family protein C protein 9
VGEILNHIPHSTIDDEPRFIVLISDLITKGTLPALPAWESSVKDEKSRLVRKKQGQKEAKEAEALAKELGVWDEFYGSGKTGERKGKGKGNGKGKKDDEEEDHSALQALMLKRKKQNVEGFLDNLAAKYTEPEPKGGKGKRRAKAGEGSEEVPQKKTRRGASPPPEIGDEEFEKLQQTLFGDKDAAGKSKKGGKGRKVK